MPASGQFFEAPSGLDVFRLIETFLASPRALLHGIFGTGETGLVDGDGARDRGMLQICKKTAVLIPQLPQLRCHFKSGYRIP